MEQQGLPIADAHDALGDCRMTLRLLRHLDDGTNERTFDDGKPFIVRFTSVERLLTRYQKPYLRFRTPGRQECNVFDRDWPALRTAGHPVADWRNVLTL